jgi:hypothetical protein
MKKWFFLLLFFFPSFLFANKIDELVTNEDVEAFLQGQNKGFQNFYVAQLKELYPDSSYLRLADSLGVKAWQKKDFNKDGVSDLLVYGLLGIHHYLLAVIDEGKKYSFCYLNRGLSGNPFLPVIKDINGMPAILLHNSCVFCKVQTKKITGTDTLVYRFGNFIEINRDEHIYSIEKIQFSTKKCFEDCPIFELEIKADKGIAYSARENNPQNGNFTTVMDTISYISLVGLLNYIDFPSLQNSYWADWTDDQTGDLIITYDHGKTKSIHDRGLAGSYGLFELYNQLFELRKSQKWKQEK